MIKLIVTLLYHRITNKAGICSNFQVVYCQTYTLCYCPRRLPVIRISVDVMVFADVDSVPFFHSMVYIRSNNANFVVFFIFQLLNVSMSLILQQLMRI